MLVKFLMIIFFPLAFSACVFGPSTATINVPTPTSTTTSTTTIAGVNGLPGGPRAARIIFQQSYPSGSFDTSPTGGTPDTPGSGQQAMRVFNPDGSLLASGGTAATAWPQWLTSFEIGISGTSNTAAPNPDCARFAQLSESTANNCVFTSPFTSYNTTCGAGSGMYRVSEFDCTSTTLPSTKGNGGPSDGVYLRATFSRNTSILASTENLLVVLEYSASGVNPSPQTPTNCFNNGVFDSTVAGCSDMTWNAYIKHSTSEVVQPYLMLVPPVIGFANFTAQTGGSGVSTKQFYIPLASDPNLQVLQISRINALQNSSTVQGASGPLFTTVCGPDSPLCVGMILYSITFYRI